MTQAWTPLSETTVRLGLGPTNYAGQAAAFAFAVCGHLNDISAEVVTYRLPGSFDYPTDAAIETSLLARSSVQRAQIRRVVGRYTHVLVDAFKPLFGRLYGSDIGGDLALLNRAGVKVGLLAHGSEIRDPRRHLEREPESHFREAPSAILASLTATADRNRRFAERSGLPIFVTTPDLLVDVPWAVWAPLVVVTSGWTPTPPPERDRLVVLHAPSRRWTKSTSRILPVVDDLRQRGSIELRMAEGISSAEMGSWIRDADIVLDQFGTGSYGALACEAMAAGRPVVGYLSADTVRAIGETPPIVNATAATLRDTLDALIGDAELRATIGTAGVDYVQRLHDGQRTAEALAPFLMANRAG